MEQKTECQKKKKKSPFANMVENLPKVFISLNVTQENGTSSSKTGFDQLKLNQCKVVIHDLVHSVTYK